MKQLNNQPFYTASEVVEILIKAKELGVVTMKLQGFEAAFDVQDPPKVVSSTLLNSLPNKKSNACETCGRIKVQGRFGLYCHACWLAEKEDTEKA